VEDGGRNLKRGRRAEDQARQHGHNQYEAERGCVRAHVSKQRNAHGIQVGQSARPSYREDQPERCATAGQHHTLGQGLTNQTPPSRSERRADRDLLLTRRGSRQQQIRQIRADNEHDDGDRAPEHQQRLPDAPADVLRHRDIAFDVPLAKSSWIALRILPSSHTNPVFAIVDGKPIRASRRSAE